jgi:hypothetical protein
MGTNHFLLCTEKPIRADIKNGFLFHQSPRRFCNRELPAICGQLSACFSASSLNIVHPHARGNRLKNGWMGRFLLSKNEEVFAECGKMNDAALERVDRNQRLLQLVLSLFCDPAANGV